MVYLWANHDSDYTIACVQEAIRLLGGHAKLGGKFWFLQDAGPGLRSYQFMGSMALGLWDQHRKESNFTYGAENHFKSDVDRIFAVLDQEFQKHAAEKIMWNEEDVAKCFADWAELFMQNDANPRVHVQVTIFYHVHMDLCVCMVFTVKVMKL